MSEYADYCPVHGIPMWWWPTGGEWACQRSTCEMTAPVRWQETETFRSIRATWLAGERLSAMVAPPYSMRIVSHGLY